MHRALCFNSFSIAQQTCVSEFTVFLFLLSLPPSLTHPLTHSLPLSLSHTHTQTISLLSVSHTVAIRGSEAYVSTMSPDEDMESTIIPDLLSRWREESQALDRYAANRCIAALRNKLLNKLVEIHNAEAELKKTENKEKAQSSSAQPKSTTSHDIETPGTRQMTTPLVATPRTEVEQVLLQIIRAI